MEKKEKAPVLRFKDTNGKDYPAWEQRKLGEASEVIVAGGDIDKASLKTKGKYPVIANALERDGVVGYYENQYRIEAPAVTVTGRGNVGKAKARFQSFTPVVRLLAIRSIHDPVFLENAINRLHIIVESTGVPQLTVPQLSNNVLMFPSNLEEEEKIGAVFSSLDKVITLHQRKLEALKKLKRTLLQKMFPKKGHLKPELRFFGFTNDWEQRKLGDIGTVQMNKRIFKTQTSTSGEIPFYKIGTFGKIPDAYISRELFEEYKKKYPYPKKGDLLLSASGSIGNVVEYNGEEAYFQDSNIVWLEHGKTISNFFLKAFYSVVNWEGIEGTTIKRLYNKTILDTPITLPSFEEQEKIGNFFTVLDKVITLHQRKLEIYKKLKKGLLQKMFI